MAAPYGQCIEAWRFDHTSAGYDSPHFGTKRQSPAVCPFLLAVVQLVARSLVSERPATSPRRAPWLLPLSPLGAEREMDYVVEARGALRLWMTSYELEEIRREAPYQATILLPFLLENSRRIPGETPGNDNELMKEHTPRSGTVSSGGMAGTSGAAGMANGDGRTTGGRVPRGRTSPTLRRGRDGRITGCGSGLSSAGTRRPTWRSTGGPSRSSSPWSGICRPSSSTWTMPRSPVSTTWTPSSTFWTSSPGRNRLQRWEGLWEGPFSRGTARARRAYRSLLFAGIRSSRWQRSTCPSRTSSRASCWRSTRTWASRARWICELWQEVRTSTSEWPRLSRSWIWMRKDWRSRASP